MSVRGIPASRYNVTELVTGANSAAEMDVTITLSSANLTKNIEEEYTKRLREFNLIDPRKLKRITIRRCNCLAKSKSLKHL